MKQPDRIGELAEMKGPVALAIGVFDGLHIGHQEVVRAAVEHARQHHGTAVVLTFDPHPAAVLNPARLPPRLITTAHQRRLGAELGADRLLALSFTEAFARTTAEQFVQLLVDSCHPLGCVSVGYDWRFGMNGGGNVHLLMDAGARHGFAVYGVPSVRVRDRVVSSTWVREAVQTGNLRLAAELLGRPFGYFGRVAQGRKLGGQIGFPTANLPLETQVHPPAGVYACEVLIDSEPRPAVCNLGRRPTIESDGTLLLEAHVLDWCGDLYGKEIEVRLLHHVRPERRFNGLAELQAQIARDVETARNFFAEQGKG